LPSSYVEGIDIQKAEFEMGKFSYLRGEQRLGGWWYYYLYCIAVKVPIGTAVLALLALRPRQLRHSLSAGTLNEVVVLAPALLVLLLVSSQTGFSRHFRYLLPAFPFAYVSISKAFGTCPGLSRRLGYSLAGCLCWSIASSMAAFPHSLSYFNEIAGGPFCGHGHLLDANIDWGQDLLYLARWKINHPEIVPLRLSFFGTVEPTIAGLDAAPLDHKTRGYRGDYELAEVSVPLESGWYAISVNHLRAYRHWKSRSNPDDGSFLGHHPRACAGYSIYIYEIPAASTRR
jgi:hypothetical protein